jgi:hypothetical protein
LNPDPSCFNLDPDPSSFNLSLGIYCTLPSKILYNPNNSKVRKHGINMKDGKDARH